MSRISVLASCALLAVLAGCFAGSTPETRAVLGGEEPAPPAAKPKDAAAKEGAKAGKAALDQALASAKAENKLVLVKFTAEWCPPCQDMKRAIDAGRFTKQLDRMVFVEVDTDLAENEELGKTYHPEGGIPYVLILRPDGSRVDEMLGYDTASGFASFLDAAIKRGLG